MITEVELANKNYSFSNAEGNQYVSDEQIQASIKLTEQLAKNRATAKSIEAETGCKKPLINIGKKKKAYEECLANAAAKKQAAQESYTPPPPARTPEKKTFLGMPQDVGIVVTVLGSAAVLFLGYKYLIAKKA